MNFFTKAAVTLLRGLGLTDTRLYQFIAGGLTVAGPPVTVNSAMQLDTVWACVRLIAQTIATLPLFVYRKNRNGQGEVDDTHALYALLHDRPNIDMTAVEFWESMVACLLLWGNAYASIERVGNRIVALYPLMPERLTVRRNQDGSLTYRYSRCAQAIEFAEEDIYHIKGFSLDGLVGISVIGQARQMLSTAIAAETATASFLKNGMRPSAIATSKEILNDTQRGQFRSMIERYTGAMNAGAIPIMEGPFGLQNLGLPPEDAQLLETRSFHVEQICRWFDVPPVMVHHMEKTTAWGTGLEQMMIWFLVFSLRPHLKRIEQSISKSLLKPQERSIYYAEFNVEGLLRADSKSRSDLYIALVDHGLRTRNEVRALDNMPPLPGGDVLTVMANLLPITLLGTVAKLPTEKPVDPSYVPPAAALPAPSEDQGGVKSAHWSDMTAFLKANGIDTSAMLTRH